MAGDVFSLKNNLYFEFAAPNATTFTWGVSSWDDGDVWDTNPSSSDWRNLRCETFDVSIDKGCDVTSGIFVSPSSSTAVIRMQGADWDPFSNKSIHAGTGFRIQVEPNPDTHPGDTYIIWQGTVRDYNAAYDQRGNNVVTITCVDAMQDFLNKKVASYSIPDGTVYPGNVISDMCNTYYYGVVPNINPDVSVMGPKDYINSTVGEVIADCLTAGLGAFWMERDGTLNYRSEEDLANIIESTYSFHFSTEHSASADHICMTDLVMKADSRDLPNVIIATARGATRTLTNVDAYDLFGAVSLNVDVLLDSSTHLDDWLGRLNLTTKLRRVETLNFDAAKRTGQLWDWWLVERLFDPNIVSYNINGIDFSETYFVTRQTDTITPYTWNIGLELWRGI
jgi:hypothetical protein